MQCHVRLFGVFGTIYEEMVELTYGSENPDNEVSLESRRLDAVLSEYEMLVNWKAESCERHWLTT